MYWLWRGSPTPPQSTYLRPIQAVPGLPKHVKTPRGTPVGGREWRCGSCGVRCVCLWCYIAVHISLRVLISIMSPRPPRPRTTLRVAVDRTPPGTRAYELPLQAPLCTPATCSTRRPTRAKSERVHNEGASTRIVACVEFNTRTSRMDFQRCWCARTGFGHVQESR